MAKYFLLPFVIMIAVLAVPLSAFAHVLKTDGTIGAVLHILPDDAPVVNEPTTFELAFQNSDGAFYLQNCDCSVTLVQDGKILQTIPLTALSATVSKGVVIFPKAGVYTLRVKGVPGEGATYKPFSLEYVVRASGGLAEQRQIPPLLWVGIGLAIGLVLLLAYAFEYAGE